MFQQSSTVDEVVLSARRTAKLETYRILSPFSFSCDQHSRLPIALSPSDY
jgi:hypothetical protein